MKLFTLIIVFLIVASCSSHYNKYNKVFEAIALDCQKNNYSEENYLIDTIFYQDKEYSGIYSSKNLGFNNSLHKILLQNKNPQWLDPSERNNIPEYVQKDKFKGPYSVLYVSEFKNGIVQANLASPYPYGQYCGSITYYKFCFKSGKSYLDKTYSFHEECF